MRILLLACSVVLVPVCLQQETSPIYNHQKVLSPEEPVASVNYGTSLNRKERNIFALKRGSSLGFKQTALNLIFGKIYQAVAVGTAKATQLNRLNLANNRALGFGVQCSSCQSGRGTVRPPTATTTEEVPQFDRVRVRLEVPADLILIGYRLTNNISRIIGSVFLNTADRKQQLVEAAKPYFAAKLGLDISASSFTTPEPIESLVPRLGPPLGGQTPGTSPTPPEEVSANRIDRSGLRTF